MNLKAENSDNEYTYEIEIRVLGDTSELTIAIRIILLAAILIAVVFMLI